MMQYKHKVAPHSASCRQRIMQAMEQDAEDKDKAEREKLRWVTTPTDVDQNADRRGAYQAGDRVKLCGLVRQPTLNGKIGTVEQFLEGIA